MEEIRKTQEDLIASKESREKYIDRFDVLEKVKELLLLPGTELATVKQVANFYEVDADVIKKICKRHSDELETDGVKFVKYKEILRGQRVPLETAKESFSNLQYENITTSRGKVTFALKNGEELDFPTRGLKLFPKRAILRVGMLLRDSDVAKEVRTQLLNIEEKASAEVKIQDINDEQRLLLNIGLAYASGNINAVLNATTEYNEFQNRHIQKLENDNRALSESILEWEDRKKLNAGVRRLAVVTENSFGTVWNELYRNLQYKHGICLKKRGPSPYIQYIKEEEWQNVIKTFSAICEAYNQSPTDMFQQTPHTYSCSA